MLLLNDDIVPASDLLERHLAIQAEIEPKTALLGSFASLFNAGQMFVYSVKLAVVAVGLTLLYVLLTTLFNYLKLRLERREMHQRGRISGTVLQLITGVPKLRVTGSEDHAFRVWATSFDEMRSTAFKVGRIGNLMPLMNGAFRHSDSPE